jgi:hypothetical protein
MNKEIWHLHVTEYHSDFKKKFLIFVATWMNQEDIILGHIKDGYYIISMICAFFNTNAK